jgi:hypothetical protein
MGRGSRTTSTAATATRQSVFAPDLDADQRDALLEAIQYHYLRVGIEPSVGAFYDDIDFSEEENETRKALHSAVEMIKCDRHSNGVEFSAEERTALFDALEYHYLAGEIEPDTGVVSGYGVPVEDLSESEQDTRATILALKDIFAEN